jgi:hypothetical protein
LLQEVTLTIKDFQTQPGKSVVSKGFLEAENPISGWNTLVITSHNGTITQELNGKLVNDGKAASATKGRILLQYESYPIDFRNLTICKVKVISTRYNNRTIYYNYKLFYSIYNLLIVILQY